MANKDSIRSTLNEIEYTHTRWGELICGTKEQLRSLGIGIDVLFPGEGGKKHRAISVIDPRGFKTKIEHCGHKKEGIFAASIEFPGRGFPRGKWEPFLPGIRMKESAWEDLYIGTAKALSDAGLAHPDKFPGWPGMGKTQVTIYPDEMAATEKTVTSCPTGRKIIKRVSKLHYEVSIRVSDEEGKRRRIAYKKLEEDWEKKMDALPRPAPLCASKALIDRVKFAKQDERFQSFLSGLSK